MMKKSISNVLTEKNEAAIKSFNMILKWPEEIGIPLNDILVPQRLKGSAFLMNQKKVKQTKITNFFFKQ